MLKKLFSISEYNDTHNIIQILGIKFKYAKKEFLEFKKHLPFESYKKNNIDITSIPPAEGQLRDIQLANLALLVEFDYVCKQSGLKYWLDFGTLLGAVRHLGFIPWDDDIDIGMPREDYEKIIKTFKKNSRNPDVYADYVVCNNKPCQCIIKIKHKKCPHLFIDIFPYDIYGTQLTLEEQLAKTIFIKKLRKDMQKKCSKNASKDSILKLINNNRSKLLKKATNSSDYVWGIDFSHHWENWFTDKNMLFPLKEITFENISFPCINDIEGYLKKVYGNFMTYPKKFGYGHSLYAKLTDEEINIIKELRSSCEKSINIRNI